MGTQLKTTIEISDAVVEQVKQLAAAEGVTLRSLMEEGLRRVLNERQARPKFRLRKG